MARRPLAITVAVLLSTATLATARVLSYAPYSDRLSIPTIALRLNRHFALVETASTNAYFTTAGHGQIVLYDSKGEDEPRVIYPQDGTEATFEGVAVRERSDEPPMIFAITSESTPKWLLSIDGGKTWKNVGITGHLSFLYSSLVDTGGLFARSRYSSLRIGPHDTPFVAVVSASDGIHLTGINLDGTTRELMKVPAGSTFQLVGHDFDRQRYLVRNGAEIDMVTINGVVTTVGPAMNGSLEGWVTPNGAAYVELWNGAADISLWQYSNGTKTFIAGTYDKTNPSAVAPPAPSGTNNPFFAVPTALYDGAWIISRAVGAPTRLLRHDSRGLVEQWSDITAPEVEALHPALSGDKVLIQVHRQRRSVDALFRDPALAVWRVGTPAPRFYDELYMNEQPDKGFVHVDVDQLESGDPFVFDSGRLVNQGCGCGLSSGGGGGGDVVQEWGVVRASLAQHLVLPGFGRTAGAFGSLWRSDLTLSNPNDAAVNVTLRFVAAGASVVASEAGTVRVTLAPHELRLVADAAKELFGMEGGVGALFIDPDPGTSINVVGRTYNQSSAGTYGYGMDATDIYAAASARFPVTFAAAFQGDNFRTNFFMTDVSGRGTSAAFTASGPYGDMQANALSTDTTAFGVVQRNGLATLLGLGTNPVGALSVKPTNGEGVAALFAIDNRTNDSTFFPPDLSAGTTRIIPVVGHLPGANNSEFRSDLFLYNTSTQSKTVIIEMRSWTSTSDIATVNLTLLPREARMIPDVLKTMFNRTGTARLRVSSQVGFSGGTPDNSVHVTSRTYTVDANGGTYGFLMPPLNNFQSAGTGDSLEILGTVIDKRFRTNIGLVDVTASFSSLTPSARIDIIGSPGTIIDTFTTSVPSLGGVQLNDIFRARALPHDGQPVLIRITPLQGMLGAYAAMVDNESNDPMYFAADLAAKP